MRRALWCLAALVLLACDVAANPASSLALLRIDAAQPVPGVPDGQAAGPSVDGIGLLATRIWPGQVGKPISLVLSEGATAAVLHLVGDSLHYIVPAGAPDVTAPTLPTLSTRLSFAPWLDRGPHTLLISAVDASGRSGPGVFQRLDAVADPLAPPEPESFLHITLRWDRAADLDLHVQEPSGRVVWSRHKASTASPGLGILDLDSNAGCVLDGQQREQVRYPQPPAAGRYRIRVSTYSLCRQATAYWSVEAYRFGQAAPLAIARGQSLPSDTRTGQGAESGILALELDLP
ncbi:MAG: hypothetical protein JNJ46_18170 [Myxococcales bacterium]|nr:hypothetical protein [Myxococcales bacterium]